MTTCLSSGSGQRGRPGAANRCATAAVSPRATAKQFANTLLGTQRLAAEVDRLSRTTAVARRRLKLLSHPA